MQKTTFLKKEESDKNWYYIDATDLILGRLSTRVATILMGKHKPTYTPHIDNGDYVIILNSEKIKLTGNKLKDKIYYRHSGYPGGLKERTAGSILQKHPERLLEMAIKNMLPKTILGRRMYRKLFVYAGDQHDHDAQQPTELKIN